MVEGTGLGLAMVRGFAEQSGGGFDIASAPRHGTTVTLWFPVAEGGLSDITVSVDSAAVTAARRKQARLLLVDDDAVVREVIKELMEASGFVVLPAESATAALEVITSDEAVDLPVPDLSMPGMDGLSLIQEAQHYRPGLPAILLTGLAIDATEIAVGGAVSGRFSLLRKPVQGQQLAERVAVLLEAASAAN